mgnify:CR=1 FL=1
MANPFKTAKNVALGTAAVGGLLAVKIPLVHYWIKRRAERLKRMQGNRLQFGKQTRAHQRATLYYRRGQLKDLEQIYKSGYQRKPKFPGAQKRRSLF